MFADTLPWKSSPLTPSSALGTGHFWRDFPATKTKLK
jgi:hypothetical protein